MRYGLWVPAVVAGLVSAALPAQALPLAGRLAGQDDGITLVRDGCGPFGHRSHYGYCKENGPGPEYGPGGYGGYGYGYRRGPAFFEDGGYRERRCFIRETYEGPVRVCR